MVYHRGKLRQDSRGIGRITEYGYVGLERARLVEKLGQCSHITATGNRCDQPAVKGGKCMRHAKTTAQLLKHKMNVKKQRQAKGGSLYATMLSGDEIDLIKTMSLGSVDEELKLARVMLRRETSNVLKLESTKTVGGHWKDGTLKGGKVIETVMRAPDLQARIDKWARLILTLERTRAELQGKLPPPPVAPSVYHVHFDKASGDDEDE